MAKKKNSIPPVDVKKAQEAVPTPAPEPTPKVREPLSIYDFKVQAVIVALLALIFYANTWYNEYAHDDGIVIIKNEYVQEGFAGIPKILTKDAYDSYYRQLNTVNQLAGGRYRPLSIVTFAIEQQFFGAIPVDKVDSVLSQNLSYGLRGPAEQKVVHDMHIRHLFNVLWYMLSVVIVLYFLRYIIFRNNPMMALVAAVLFTIHPIHTEVVANVKSRDEIMSLLFMCLTFIFAFKYQDAKKEMERFKKTAVQKSNPVSYLLWGLLCFLLAFLSKEYAITLLVLLPLSLYLFDEKPLPDSIKSMAPFLGVFVIYILIRIKVAMGGAGVTDGTEKSFYDMMQSLKSGDNSEKEVLNNPYYFATPVQKIATEIASSLTYVKLLFFPQPLSADYSYNSIPYKNFGDWQVILSLIVHTAMAAGAYIFMFVKKQYKVIGFALAFYLMHLLLVNNLVFNIGATLGERLIYHSSLGFAIIISWLLCTGLSKLGSVRSANVALAAILTIVTLLCGYKTISRNRDWKNDKTLFMQDINVVPNSVLVNGNVGASYVTMSDLEKNDTLRTQYLHKAIYHLGKAIAIHPGFVAGYLNQGIAYYKLGNVDSAQACLDSVRKYYPNYPTLKNLYSLLGDYHMKIGWSKYGLHGLYPQAIAEFQQGIAIDSTNAELWYNLGGAYFSNKQYPEAINAWTRSLAIKPDQPQAQQGMRAAQGIMAAGQQQRMPQPQQKKH